MSQPKLKPPPLRAGDKVAIVAPASNIRPDALEAGCRRLRKIGYEPVYDPGILEQDLYFAGPVERRLEELHRAFVNSEIRAILCARGGYGANYLLPRLDLDLIRRHPKIFVGYSDLTCLLTWLRDVAGLVTFHGPMVAKDFASEEGIDVNSWSAALSGEHDSRFSEDAGIAPLVPGGAEGELYGGCLSILVASLGTPYEIRTEGKLLFLEDVAAKPYQIDRMLMQLRLSGKLHGVRGIIFGEMLDCVQAPDQPYTLQEIVRRVLGDLGVPVAWGLRSGHVTRGNVTLPIGVRAALEVTGKAAELRILEPATATTETASVRLS